MSVGIWQLVLVLFVVLIVFGSARLPKAMADVAESIRNFRAGIADDEKHEKLLTSDTLGPEIADDRLKMDAPRPSLEARRSTGIHRRASDH